jgi:ABC-type multidrug transport system fused ATPase/permease subunit
VFVSLFLFRCRYGGLLVLRGPQELSTGQLTAYILYVIYSVFAITQLVSTINSNAAASAAAARIDEILNRRPMAASERGQTLTNFRGLVEFKNVRTIPPTPLPPSLLLPLFSTDSISHKPAPIVTCQLF